VTVSATELAPVIGSMGSDDLGNSDESDFHNRLGSISWESASIRRPARCRAARSS